MSYIQFQQQCADCGQSWNAAFGIVGTTQIASPPSVCPFCQSEHISKSADGWATYGDQMNETQSAPAWTSNAAYRAPIQGFHGEAVYWCDRCDAWWLASRVSVSCCVMHSPGDCCHMSETKVEVHAL